MAFVLRSPAFEPGDRIPKLYTCDGKDVSPPLRWDGSPAGSGSFALICDDPDAPMGTWVHWVIWNIPAGSTSLPEGVQAVQLLEDGAAQGSNDFGRIGYGGPCPPRGNAHRYFFRLYALEGKLSASTVLDRAALLKAMDGYILAEAELYGTYGRT